MLVSSGFGWSHLYRSVIGRIVLFQQGIQNVNIPIGVVGREVLQHPRFQGLITFALDRIPVNIIMAEKYFHILVFRVRLPSL